LKKLTCKTDGSSFEIRGSDVGLAL